MQISTILGNKGNAVITLNISKTVGDAVQLLREKNIGALIIVDDSGAVVGISSERDVVRKLGANPANLLAQNIAECMTAKPYTSTSDETIDDVMGKMTQYRIRHMPIVDEGKLVGIVSIGDVVKRKIELAESEREALKEYIAG